MSYNVKTIPYFEKQAKRLIKKYASFKKELNDLIDSLEENPQQGNSIGNDCYKIRLAIKSKGRGKSGGARVITHIIAVKKNVYLLSVYNKSEKENISDSEIKKLIQSIDC